MRTLIGFLALTVAQSAHAGLGTSIGLSPGGLGFAGTGGAFFPGGGFLPTLDYRSDPLVLQFHVLEFAVLALETQDVFVGANIYYEAARGPIGGGWKGVAQPGAGIDILGDPFILTVTGEARFGAESGNNIGVGVYAVPALGVWVGDGDSGFVAGGALQFSIWLGGSGGGSTGGGGEEGGP